MASMTYFLLSILGATALLLLFDHAPWTCEAQPHPFPMGFTIYAVSECNSSQWRMSGFDEGPALVTETAQCKLRSFNVCMELQYYPEICTSRVLTTEVTGNCPQQGSYVNATFATLTPGDDALPQDMWVVNFNSTNPMLPVLAKGGLHCRYDQCSVVVPTRADDLLSNDIIISEAKNWTCMTNITVQSHGWLPDRPLPLGELHCNEEEIDKRCH